MFVAIVVLIAKLLVGAVLSLVELFLPVRRKEITGQVVLVTGARRGIGRALAEEFGRHGARLALLDVDEEDMRQVAAELNNHGVEARGYKCDVTKSSDVTKVVEHVTNDLGEVDILVNNAGVINIREVLSLTETQIRTCMEVNSLSHFWTVRACLPAMIARNHGHVVTIASMAAKVGTPLLTDYSMSKFGVFGFTEALAKELREIYQVDKVFTTVVCPLFVNTAMVSKVHAPYKSRVGRLLEPREVAQAVVDGVLANRKEVYIPGHLGVLSDIGRALFPRRWGEAIDEFMDAGFQHPNDHQHKAN